jgi:hypothetical protein
MLQQQRVAGLNPARIANKIKFLQAQEKIHFRGCAHVMHTREWRAAAVDRCVARRQIERLGDEPFAPHLATLLAMLREQQVERLSDQLLLLAARLMRKVA